MSDQLPPCDHDDCPKAGPCKKDWPEDFSHENGNYQCECVLCHGQFTGHKRRNVCKECAINDARKANPFAPLEPPFRYGHETETIADKHGRTVAFPTLSDIGQTISELMNRECEKSERNQ